jgi:hypothetical protein
MDYKQILDRYLDNLEDIKGISYISHENAGYAYQYSVDHDGPWSSLCFRVNASWLFDHDEARINKDGNIEFDGIVIPSNPDINKIRRRAEDFLRKSNNDIIWQIALYLGIKLD